MSDTELKKIGYLVDDLLKACEHLKQENIVLREKQASLKAERSKLIEKNALARDRVEGMIKRMKVSGNAE